LIVEGFGFGVNGLLVVVVEFLNDVVVGDIDKFVVVICVDDGVVFVNKLVIS